MLMIVAHLVEVTVKKIGIPESNSHLFANGHLALILIAALLFN